jgi:hypothetical protein
MLHSADDVSTLTRPDPKNDDEDVKADTDETVTARTAAMEIFIVDNIYTDETRTARNSKDKTQNDECCNRRRKQKGILFLRLKVADGWSSDGYSKESIPT